MAPESLFRGTFSTKSDIWSFGILVFEIVTLGSTPYGGMSAKELLRKLSQGYRLERPVHCGRELYNIMYHCWNTCPDKRPPFSELASQLSDMLSNAQDYLQPSKFPDNTYYNMILNNLSDEKV